jgi:hypothetical protein
MVQRPFDVVLGRLERERLEAQTEMT